MFQEIIIPDHSDFMTKERKINKKGEEENFKIYEEEKQTIHYNPFFLCTGYPPHQERLFLKKYLIFKGFIALPLYKK